MDKEKDVYFVRHGESEENVTHVFGDHTVPLTEKGRAQAVQVATRVAELGIDTLISSPFQRALETAQAISKHVGLPIEQSDLFGEWKIPSHHVGYYRDDPDIKEERDMIFSSSDADYRQSDEETFNELSDRASCAMDFIVANPGKRLCIVTHGGFLSAIVGTVALAPVFSNKNFFGLFNHLVLNNTGVVHIRYDTKRERWRFVIWNDTTHLTS